MNSTQTPYDVRCVCPHDCPDTCGMIVTVKDGQAVNLKGDPDHPFTKGFLCVKVSRYLERVYHPDRLLYPLRRIGPKGGGIENFERTTWDAALAETATRMQSIRASLDGPQAILPYSYAGTMGLLQFASMDRRFFHSLGASLLDRTICATAGAAGSQITLGTRAMIDPEAVIHSRYIINWGSNTSVTNMHLWSIMFQARKQGAKIVTIDPHRSKTASRSDWWIPIRPGTDAALALGLMHVIFRDGLQDKAYLHQHCLGSEALQARVLNDYPPEKVAQITGIPTQDIELLATELATRQPSFIRLNYGLQRHFGGGMAVRTICALPAVIGSWKHVGGGALLSTSKAYGFDTQRLERPDLIPPETRTINMVQLAEALNGDLPGPPVKMLFVYNSNPASVCPDQARVLRGLMRDDLSVIVHEQFFTDTCRYADVIFPATTQLEHFDIHNSYGHLYVQVNQPAIAPRGEAKPNTELFRLLARRLEMDAALFAKSDEQLAEDLLIDPASTLAGITLDRLKQEGPIRIQLPTHYAPFAEGAFPTASGKCELYSAALEAMGHDPLPTYTPPAEDPLTRPDLAKDFPLHCITPPHPSFLNSTFVNVDSLRAHAGEPSVEIHPQDANPRGIQTGDLIAIWNQRGRYLARAVVSETVKPGVVAALGLWWSQLTHEGLNCNATTSSRLTDFGGGATFFDNLVQVAKSSSVNGTA